MHVQRVPRFMTPDGSRPERPILRVASCMAFSGREGCLSPARINSPPSRAALPDHDALPGRSAVMSEGADNDFRETAGPGIMVSHVSSGSVPL